MFEIFCSCSSTKNLDLSLCKEIWFFCACTTDDKYTEREIKIQVSPSFWRGIYRKTGYYTTFKFWQFVTIRWFFLAYISSFCMAADPRMTKAITTTTKKKYKKYYCDLLRTTTKQCNHSLYSIMQMHFKTTGTPGCLPHRHSGRKELDRISTGAAKLKKLLHSCTCTLVFYPEQNADLHSTYRTQKYIMPLHTHTHIQRFDILQAFKENKNNPATLCELELTSSQKWRYWLAWEWWSSVALMEQYCEDLPQSPTDKHYRMQSSPNLTTVLKCTVVHFYMFGSHTCYYKEQ